MPPVVEAKKVAAATSHHHHAESTTDKSFRRQPNDPPSIRLTSNPANTFEERAGLSHTLSNHNLARVHSFADTAASSSDLSRRASIGQPDEQQGSQQQRRSRAQSLHDAVNAFRDYSSDVFANDADADPTKPPAEVQNDNWMNEWMSVVEQMDKRGGVALTEANRSIFGPPLKIKQDGDFEEMAAAVKDVLLKSESDYAEAVAFADRTNFLSDPQDCCVRNVTSLMATAASCYTTLRSLFHSLEFQLAVEKMTSYSSLMRSIRSIVYLAESTGNSVEQIQQQTIASNAMKLKYEATIRTLRRQLADFHGENNTVGRGVDGQFAVQTKQTRPAGPKTGKGPQAKFVIVVQFEDPGLFRKKPMVLRDMIHVARSTAIECAPAFRCTRTNYFQADEEAEERKQGPVVNRCYMFATSESYDALAFALTLHQTLNAPSTAWPLAVVTSAKYGQELWRGLRARIAVHHGIPDEMDLGDTVEQKTKHYEGVVVEKCMRVCGLGGAGDTVISSSAWELFTTDQKASQIPTSSEYDALRGLEMEKQSAPPRYGFKKSEYVMRLWSKKLAARRTNTCDADFDRPAFYQVEAMEGGDGYDDQNAPLTADELLQVKDTEIIVLQQELDTVRLAIIKRDADIAELQQKLYYTIAKMQEKSKLKEVVLRETVRQLENQVMGLMDGSEDVLGFCDSSSQGPDTPSNHSLMSGLSSRRRDVLQGAGFVTADNLVQQFLADVATKREAKKKAARDKIVAEMTGSPVTPADTGLQPMHEHKNVKLWRDLMQTVESTSIPTVTVTPPHRSSSGIFKSDSGGHYGSNALLRAHNAVKVFHALLKRFCTEEDRPGDVDNKGLSEDQFMRLFVTKVQSDGLTSGGSAQGWKLANPREQITWLAALAIEADDVEVANRFDDARLARSIAGHLSAIYVVVRNLKRYSRFDSNNAAGGPGSASSPGSGTLAAPSASQGATRQRRKSIGGPGAMMTTTAVAPTLSASNPRQRTTSIVDPATKALQDENHQLKEQLAKLQSQQQHHDRLHRPPGSPHVGPLDVPSRPGRRKSLTAVDAPPPPPTAPLEGVSHARPVADDSAIASPTASPVAAPAVVGSRATPVPSLRRANTGMDSHAGSPLLQAQFAENMATTTAAAAEGGAHVNDPPFVAFAPLPASAITTSASSPAEAAPLSTAALAAMDPVTEPSRPNVVSPGRRATLQPSIQNFGGMMFGNPSNNNTPQQHSLHHPQGHTMHDLAARPGSQAQRMAAQVPERWRSSVSHLATQLAAVGAGQRPSSGATLAPPAGQQQPPTAVLPMRAAFGPAVTPPPVLVAGGHGGQVVKAQTATLPLVTNRPSSPGGYGPVRPVGAPMQREELERQLDELRQLQRAAVALRSGAASHAVPPSRGQSRQAPSAQTGGATSGNLLPSGSSSGMAVVRTMQLAVRSTSPRAKRW